MVGGGVGWQARGEEEFDVYYFLYVRNFMCVYSTYVCAYYLPMVGLF